MYRLLTVVHGLKVIHQGQDVPVAHRHSFQDCDLVPDHVFSPSHKPFVDDLRSIVSPCVDVYTLLNHRVAAGAQRLSGLVAAWLHLRLRLWGGCSIRSHVCGCGRLWFAMIYTARCR